MKKLFLLVLLVLAASLWVGGKVMQDPGYMLLSYQNTTVEMSLWLGLLVIVIFALLVVGLFWSMGKVMASGDTLKRWNYGIRQRRALTKTNAGLIAYLEGDWVYAQKKLDQAAVKTDTPLISYLAATRAAAKNGDFESSDRYLRKASEEVPSAKLAIGLAKADIQAQRGQHEQALASLLQMKQSHPKHKEVCRRLQDVYLALQDWEALGQLMPLLRKLKVAPVAELDYVEQKTAISVLQRTAKEQPIGVRAAKNAAPLIKAWKGTPQKVRRQESVVLAYTELLKKFDKAELAVQPLAESIKVAWSEDLVEQFGLVIGDDVQHQLLTAERWLQERNNSPVLMLALGRLSLANKLWGKAKEYFISSVKLKKSVVASVELARLLKYLGDEKGSADYMQQGFDLMSEGFPALPSTPPQVQVSKVAG